MLLALSRTTSGESLLAAVLKQDLMVARTEPERDEEDMWVSVHTEDTVLSALKAAAKEVFDVLGTGHHESIYRNALAFELQTRGFHSQMEMPICIFYKGSFVGFGRCDVLVRGRDANTVLELKAVQKMTSPMEAQVRAYARSLGTSARAALVNFGASEVEVRPVVV